METFRGKIQTVKDAMIIFEACRQGILHMTKRRLLEKEKEELCSGQVYVFDETESSIKRWTDGRLWSPSRIIKDFLVYRELATRDRSVKRDEPIDESLQKRVQAEGLKVHQCSKGTFVLRNNGLLKKTISIKFNGTYQHMIIYEDTAEDGNNLLPPEAFEELRHIQPSEDIIKSEKMPKINRNSKKNKRKKRSLKHIVMDDCFLYQGDKIFMWNHDHDSNSDGLSDVQDEQEYAATGNIISAQPSSIIQPSITNLYSAGVNQATTNNSIAPLLCSPWPPISTTPCYDLMIREASPLTNRSSSTTYPPVNLTQDQHPADPQHQQLLQSPYILHQDYSQFINPSGTHALSGNQNNLINHYPTSGNAIVTNSSIGAAAGGDNNGGGFFFYQ